MLKFFKNLLYAVFVSRYQMIVYTVAVVAGLLVLPHTYLLSSLLLTLLFFIPISTIYEHEYLSHHQVVPKYPWLDKLICVISIIWLNGPKQFHSRHLAHHKEWKNPETDYIENCINQGWIRYFFGFANYKNFQMQPIDHLNYITKHNNDIVVAVATTLLLIDVEIFFYFWLIPIFLNKATLVLITEILQHGFQKVREKEKDFWFIIPVFGQFGVHHSHHLRLDRIVYAPLDKEWMKWINPHYYIFLLFFDEVKRKTG